MAAIRKAQLEKLQKKFITDAAIGAQFGITRQAVHQLRKKFGLGSSLKDNPHRNQKIVKAYESGESGTALAKKYNLPLLARIPLVQGICDRSDSGIPVANEDHPAAVAFRNLAQTLISLLEQ